MSGKQKEIVGILTIILGILVFLCLVSYNPIEEPSISNQVVLDNWMGLIGIYVSHFMIKSFIGISAYIFPILVILWGVWIFLKKEVKKILAGTIASILSAFLISMLLALPTVINPRMFDHDFHLSGLTAGIMAKVMFDFAGIPGTILIIVGLLLVIVRLFLSIGYVELVNHMFNKNFKLPTFKIKKNFSHSPVVPATHHERKPIEKVIPEPVSAGPSAIQPKAETLPKSPPATPRLPEKPRGKYAIPPTKFLEENLSKAPLVSKAELDRKSAILERELDTFKVQGQVVAVAPGPLITTFKVEPAAGIRVGRIARLADDLARVLEAIRVRIVAPIPGTSVVGIEIPNDEMETIYIKSILESSKFKNAQNVLTLALGKTSTGEVYTADLRKMPHLLVAGATGSGKSVAVNMMIASILYKARPDEVKFVMIDPKKLELAAYKKLIGYHLTTCENLDEYIITEPDSAVVLLKSVVLEMEQRYDMLAGASVRNIEEFNEKIHQGKLQDEKLPYIIVVIDELADLMMTSAKEIEEPIARLAQKARAVGIHLIVATQRPSVDVITGVIKANFPARMAFQVTTKIDSRTILDFNGAEKLLGRGDMLLTTPQHPEPMRLHSAYISLEELDRILDYITTQPRTECEKLPKVFVEDDINDRDEYFDPDEKDPLYDDAVRMVVNHQQGSVSLLQRRLRIGYARAGRLIDQLERDGIVGPHTGSKARDVLVDEDYLDLMMGDVNQLEG
ncbi:MAG: DNA translocase FtsK [Candidatus Marinimicrobia bacterium]|nr:DNA translocase FtsK [Candidatus Neomarinimicrobiota bacterium]